MRSRKQRRIDRALLIEEGEVLAQCASWMALANKRGMSTLEDVAYFGEMVRRSGAALKEFSQKKERMR